MARYTPGNNGLIYPENGVWNQQRVKMGNHICPYCECMLKNRFVILPILELRRNDQHQVELNIMRCKYLEMEL